jgi:hypothetical protein
MVRTQQSERANDTTAPASPRRSAPGTVLDRDSAHGLVNERHHERRASGSPSGLGRSARPSTDGEGKYDERALVGKSRSAQRDPGSNPGPGPDLDLADLPHGERFRTDVADMLDRESRGEVQASRALRWIRFYVAAWRRCRDGKCRERDFHFEAVCTKASGKSRLDRNEPERPLAQAV